MCETYTAELYYEDDAEALVALEVRQVPQIGEYVHVDWNLEKTWAGTVVDIKWLYLFDFVSNGIDRINYIVHIILRKGVM